MDKTILTQPLRLDKISYSNPKSFMRICRGSAPVPTPA